MFVENRPHPSLTAGATGASRAKELDIVLRDIEEFEGGLKRRLQSTTDCSVPAAADHGDGPSSLQFAAAGSPRRTPAPPPPLSTAGGSPHRAAEALSPLRTGKDSRLRLATPRSPCTPPHAPVHVALSPEIVKVRQEIAAWLDKVLAEP